MPQQYLFYILLAVAFVALIILPGRQRKKQAAQAQAMQESLTPGTPVMTTAGIHGKVAGLGDTTVDIEVSPGTVITFERRAIMQVRPAAGPAAPGGSTAVEGELPSSGDDTPGGTDPAGPAR